MKAGTDDRSDRTAMDDTNYRNAAQQRVLLTLTFLAQHPDGAFPSEIAQALRTLASNTTRDLANLRLAGLVVARDGRWCCSPHIIDLMRQHRRQARKRRSSGKA